MSDTPTQKDWTKAAAMAIPKGGFFKDKVEQGRYGPIFPKTPACYGFSIIAKIVPGTEEKFYEYARSIEKAVAGSPDVLAVLKLEHRIRADESGLLIADALGRPVAFEPKLATLGRDRRIDVGLAFPR